MLLLATVEGPVGLGAHTRRLYCLTLLLLLLAYAVAVLLVLWLVEVLLLNVLLLLLEGQLTGGVQRWSE